MPGHHRQPGLSPFILLLVVARVDVEAQAGGMQFPDTNQLPHLTVELWKGIPKDTVLPEKVDLSRWFPPAGNQGRQYSCVAWALCYGVMSYRNNLAEGRTYQPGDSVNGAETFSPAYLYNLITGFSRSRQEAAYDSVCENGTSIERMAELAMIGGSCSMDQMPYDTALSSCCQKPSAPDMLAAVRNNIPPGVEVSRLYPDQWRYHLAHGQPILMGIVTDTELMKGGSEAGGRKPYTWRFNPRSRVLDGHCVVCTGYDDRDSTFTFLNSWGTDWGFHGYFKATPKVLEQRGSGGYVFSNDMLWGRPKSPGKPADKDTLRGPVVHEDLDRGEYQEVNDEKVGLGSMGKGHNTAVMHVFDARTDTLVRSMTMEAGATYAVYDNDRCLRLRYDKRTWLQRLFGKTIDFTLETAPARDEYIRQRNAHIGRLQKELKEGDRP